jgi:hypothetical protein
MTNLFHLVVNVAGRWAGLCEPSCARWLWKRLQVAFPDALAAAIMLDHLHLLCGGDEVVLRRRLARIVAHVTHRFGAPGFRPVGATLVRGPEMALRTAAYIVLNPPRSRLVRDPLEWPWSTHRDVVGAVVHPWVPADRLALAVRREPMEFGRWFHGFVSRDRSVAIQGTLAPRPATRTRAPMSSLADICRAAASATHGRPRDILRPSPTRSMFLALAQAQSWPDRRQLADVCRASPSTIWRLTRHEPAGLGAGLLCLGDARLLRYDVAPPREQTFAPIDVHDPLLSLEFVDRAVRLDRSARLAQPVDRRK